MYAVGVTLVCFLCLFALNVWLDGTGVWFVSSMNKLHRRLFGPSLVEQVIEEIKARGAYVRCTLNDLNLDILVPEDRIDHFVKWAEGRNCKVTYP